MKSHRVTRNKLLKTLVIILIVLFFYIIVDVSNLLSIVGVPVENINLSTLQVVINILLTIGIFASTYILINRHEIRRIDNCANIANIMIQRSYRECLSYIQFLQEQETRDRIAKRIDFDSYGESEVTSNIKTMPFEDHEQIIGFASQGVILGKSFEEYISIKNDYCIFVTNAIIFYDRPEMLTPLADKLKKRISMALRDKGEII